jgi:hypothetical protein
VHNYGPGRVYASLHAEVPANMDMMEAHDYIDMAERRVEKRMKCFISIHMDPVVTDDEVINHLRKMTIAVVKSVGEELDDNSQWLCIFWHGWTACRILPG